MKTTRKNVFETNSSSSHSITIADSGDLINNLEIEDGFIKSSGGEFGWEEIIYSDAQTKLDYLVTFICENTMDKVEEFNISLLPNHLQKQFKMLEKAIKEFTGYGLLLEPLRDECWAFGYIDHQSSHVASEVFTSVSKIKNFIFNPKSILRTDNDNHC